MQHVEAYPHSGSESVKAHGQVTEARIRAMRPEVDEVVVPSVQLDRAVDPSPHDGRIAAAD